MQIFSASGTRRRSSRCNIHPNIGMSACESRLEFLKERASDLLSLLYSLPRHKLSPSALSRLSKLIRAELSFLHTHPSSPICTNLGYLDAVVQVLQHPHVDAVSAVSHAFRVPSCLKHGGKVAEVHTDIVCTFHAKPVWIVVSDRNPKYSYWSAECGHFKGWKSRVQLLIDVARSLCVLRPSSLLFCFARGVSDILLTGFEIDVGASRVPLFKEPSVNCSVDKEPSVNCSVDKGANIGDSGLIERDEGDWVCIYLCKDQADVDIWMHGLQCSQPFSTFDASLEQWITFQVDISAPLDGYDAQQCKSLDTQQRVIRSFPEDCFATAASMKCNHQGDTSTASELDCPLHNIHPVGEAASLSCPLHSVHPLGDACNDAFLSCLILLAGHINVSKEDLGCLSTSDLVNLDTTALIAMVSETSNGAASRLVNMCDEDLVYKFKSTAKFMKDQAKEELKERLLMEMTDIFEQRRPFISETVCKEFRSLVSLCGSFKEKARAEELLRVLPVVSDTPSSRVWNLCGTGKIKDKNKIIFGTGDFWQAPTLTANLSFVRAVRQMGMAISVLEHKPRALVGEKFG